MKQIKVGFIGNGYRCQSFLRIISELPTVFSLSGVYFRNHEKAKAFDLLHSGQAFTDKKKFYDSQPDYVVLAVPRECVLDYMKELFENNIPVLCETPPANGVEELSQVWDLKQRLNGKVQVAEQYPSQPYHTALLKIIADGLMGEVSNATISMIHDYHGIAMMRKILSENMNDCTIRGREYSFPVIKTCGRDGMIETGDISQNKRKTASFEFSDGKVGFFDFLGEQYFNYLRARHLSLQGERGEIHDTTVNYLNQDGVPVCAQMKRVDAGAYSNIEGYFHRGIMLNDHFIYKNPFNSYNPRLNDDELAIATIMKQMGDYVKSGKDFYSLSDALQDTYLYLMMDKAIETGEAVTTTNQVWQKGCL